MACFSLQTGIAGSCDTSKGGIKKVFLMTADVIPTIDSASTLPVVTGISGTTTANTFEFNFKKGTSSMESTLTVDQANGVNFVSTALALVFTKMDANKRLAMVALAKDDLKAVVIDSNGTGWFLGMDEPLNATEGTGASGTAATDGNRYSITLTDESVEWPYTVTQGVIDELEGLAG